MSIYLLMMIARRAHGLLTPLLPGDYIGAIELSRSPATSDELTSKALVAFMGH